MGMYVLNQYQMKVAKSEASKLLVEGMINSIDIANMPAGIEANEETLCQLFGDKLGEQVDEFLGDAFLGLAHDCYAPKNTPAAALSKWIKEVNDCYVINISKTSKGGWVDSETNKYTDGFFDEAKENAQQLFKIISSKMDCDVLFDVKSELETYQKRDFQKVTVASLLV